MSTVEEVLNKLVDAGYKTKETLQKDYDELIEKSKIAQPNVSEEARQAFVLNTLEGRSKTRTGNTIPVKGYFLGFGSEFDANKKDRDKALKLGIVNETGQLIFSNMPESRKKWEGQPIPTPEESSTRVARFIGTINKDGIEENWKYANLWIRTKGLIPPAASKEGILPLVKFNATGNFNTAIPALGTTENTRFEIISEEKVDFNAMIKTILPACVCDFSDIETFEPPKAYGDIIFKAQIVRATPTKKLDTNNPVELRMIANTIDDILKADNIENITMWCNRDIPLNFGEGDIVWCVANKYTKQDGTISLNGLGFFIEKTGFPVNAPLPITEENSKAVEEDVTTSKFWEE